MVVNIITGIMALIGVLALAKKAEEQTKEIVPFWEQMSLSGSRALEWLSTKNGPMNLKIESLHFGELKYFFNDFDFSNALEFKDKLTLESKIMLCKCSNFDRMVLIDQKGALKQMGKLLQIEALNDNVKSYKASELYIDADGETNVVDVDFSKEVDVTFLLEKDGKFSHYIIKEISG